MSQLRSGKGHTNKTGEFGGLVASISSAAVAVAAVFALFGSVLKELVPPIEDSKNAVAYGSLVTVAILLILSALIRKRLSQSQGKWLAVGTIALLVISVAVYFTYRDGVRTYVYRFPPSSMPNSQQTRHIRGELHAEGAKLVGRRTISEAVDAGGGPDHVDGQGMFWTQESKEGVTGRLERLYLALVLLTTTTIFLAGITVWRLADRGRKKSL